jgi:hypothetical protein
MPKAATKRVEPRTAFSKENRENIPEKKEAQVNWIGVLF